MGNIPRQHRKWEISQFIFRVRFPLPSSSRFLVWISGLWGMLCGITVLPGDVGQSLPRWDSGPAP